MMLEEFYSHEDGPERVLLAKVLRRAKETMVSGRGNLFITDDADPLQVGVLQFLTRDKVNLHLHKPVERTVIGSWEAFYVLRGRAIVTIQKGADESTRQSFLVEEDDTMIFTAASAHRIDFPVPTKLLEIKNGPYPGRAADKQDLTEEEG